MHISRGFYKKLALSGVLFCLGMLSYCIYLTVRTVNLRERVTAHSIGILDGTLLKQRAKCFSVHNETSKMLNDIFNQIRSSEKKMKDEYEQILSNKKLSHKKKQQEIARIENKWKQTSENYNQKALDIKLLDNKIFERIGKTLDNVLQEISTELNLIIILNKGSEGTLNVFYNISSLDITDKVVKLMDKKLTNFSINSVTLPKY